MKSSFNPNYIKYKVVFMLSAFYQDINKKTAELLFIINDNPIVFPEFIYYIGIANKSHLDVLTINIKRIPYIIDGILQLLSDKCNEIES